MKNRFFFFRKFGVFFMMYCFIIMSVILRKSQIFIFKKSFSDLFGGSLSLCQKLADFSRKGQDNILNFVSNTVCCSDSIFQRESSDRVYPNKWVWPCSNNGSYIKTVSEQFALLAAVCQPQPLPYAVFFFSSPDWYSSGCFFLPWMKLFQMEHGAFS